MGPHPDIIRSMGITRVDSGTVALTIHSEIKGGPRWTVGQDSSLYFDDHGVMFILAALAQMPAYRDTFRAVADELDRREIIARADGTTPAARAANRIESADTAVRLREIITEAIDNAITRM